MDVTGSGLITGVFWFIGRDLDDEGLCVWVELSWVKWDAYLEVRGRFHEWCEARESVDT